MPNNFKRLVQNSYEVSFLLSFLIVEYVALIADTTLDKILSSVLASNSIAPDFFEPPVLHYQLLAEYLSANPTAGRRFAGFRWGAQYG